MKNRFLILTLSAILGVTAVYGLMELESFIHRTNNPEYADMVNGLAEFAIPDFGLFLFFFFVVYPYQLIVRTIQRMLKERGFSVFRRDLIIFGVSTILYSVGFTIVFRSPHLGITDIIQTFFLGTLVFGVYFLTNLYTQHFLLNIGSDQRAEPMEKA
jgi:hypothetical protein